MNQDYSDTWLGLNRAGLGWVHGQKVDGGGRRPGLDMNRCNPPSKYFPEKKFKNFQILIGYDIKVPNAEL